MASIAVQSELTTLLAGVFFLLGKLVRFLFFFIFLFTVLSKSGSLAGYTCEQVIFFFLVFNLVDITLQFFFRGVYVFRPLVVQGNFDFDLLKPLPSFFRPLFGQTDILDFTTLVPLWIFSVWYVFHYHLFSSWLQVFWFLLLFLNSLLLAFAFHLLICSVCVLTTEIDHLIWVYRDLTNMARFPTDIYQKGVRFVLTFVIPVVVLITFPAKALLGLLSFKAIILAFFASFAFLFCAFRVWKFSLSRYSSASS